MIDTATLEKLVELAKAATPRPWHIEGWYSFCDSEGREVGDVCLPAHRTQEEDRANSSFITEAANLAVPLATELMEARAALESIAKNTCCGPCQEAAFVAKRALGGG